MKWIERTLSRPYLLLGVGVLLVGSVFAAQNVPKSAFNFTPRPAVELRPALVASPASVEAVRQVEEAMVALAASASQAVVHISTNMNRLNEDGAEQEPDPREMMRGGGEGSGFIVRSDGWIITNEHVVAGRDRVAVVLADGRALEGRVIPARDPQLDLAVVKVEATGLPTLELADSNKVRAGQFAIAIGAPFGIEDSVTVGYVSGIGRIGYINDFRAGTPRSYSGLIQTDASINPGNSGGPLLNSAGQVIGVNSSIVSTSGASAGIGFAIPSNFVRVVTDKLIERGSFDRGALGILPRDLKPYERRKLNIERGAIVGRNVEPDTPAYKAGIRPGDVIVQIGKREITNEVDLRTAMYAHSPGDRVDVTYIRDGRRTTVPVTLTGPSQLAQNQGRPMPRQPEFFPAPEVPPGEPFSPPSSGRPRLGVQVQSIDANVRRQFSLPGDVEGVVVVTVAEGSLAARYKLEPGDVIRTVGNRPIRTAQDVSQAMAQVKSGDMLTIAYTRFRDGSKIEYTVSIPIP